MLVISLVNAYRYTRMLNIEGFSNWPMPEIHFIASSIAVSRPLYEIEQEILRRFPNMLDTNWHVTTSSPAVVQFFCYIIRKYNDTHDTKHTAKLHLEGISVNKDLSINHKGRIVGALTAYDKELLGASLARAISAVKSSRHVIL